MHTRAESPTALIVSAHAADFVWRAAGGIATITRNGGRAHVLCLSYGERGESQGLWTNPDADEASVKARRHEQCLQAAEILGATIEFADASDYPLRATEAVYNQVVDAMRAVQPDVIMTHAQRDPYNIDHSLTHEIVIRSRMIAQAAGHDRSTSPIGAAQVLQFEPHQPEQCGFQPNVLLDISAVFDLKLKAMQVMEEAQGHLVNYYTELAGRRANQARRNGGPGSIHHAEAYERIFPVVVGDLW